jgi:hypothetical protein
MFNTIPSPYILGPVMVLISLMTNFLFGNVPSFNHRPFRSSDGQLLYVYLFNVISLDAPV